MPDSSGRAPERSVARPAADPADVGWGSPVPAEYGSLRSPGPALSQATAVRSHAASRPKSGAAPSSAVAAAASNAASSVVSLLRKIQGGGNGKVGDTPTNGSGNGRAAKAPARNGWAGWNSNPARTRSGTTTAPVRQPAPSRTTAPPASRAPGAGTPASRAPIDAPGRTTRAPTAPVTAAPATGHGPGPADSSRAPVDRRAALVAALPRPSRREERAQAAREAQLSRSRATVRHIDVWTVVRVSLIFYLVAAVVVVAASLLLWYAADAFGTLPSIEKSIRTLFGLKSFKIYPGAVAGYMALAGIVLTVAGAIANVLAALVYNLISDVVGGIRIELEAPRRRRQAP